MMKSWFRMVTAATTAAAVLTAATVALASPPRRLYGGRSHTWQIQVIAGVPVEVRVIGDGDPRAGLEVSITDIYGRIPGIHDESAGRATVCFVPRVTGMATIWIVNVGTMFNDYDIEVDGGILRE